MKKIILLSIFLITSLEAATLEIIGACSKKPVLTFEAADHFETIGDLTMYIFNKNKIPYVGNERGINSILNSPIGLETLEVLSDTQMRSYGWCYAVNGVIVENYPDEVTLKTGDHVSWIYSYAWYDREWKSMCHPAFEVTDNPFCQR